METREVLGLVCKAMMACLAIAGLGLYPFVDRSGRRGAAIRMSRGRSPFLTDC